MLGRGTGRLRPQVWWEGPAGASCKGANRQPHPTREVQRCAAAAQVPGCTAAMRHVLDASTMGALHTTAGRVCPCGPALLRPASWPLPTVHKYAGIHCPYMYMYGDACILQAEGDGRRHCHWGRGGAAHSVAGEAGQPLGNGEFRW